MNLFPLIASWTIVIWIILALVVPFVVLGLILIIRNKPEEDDEEQGKRIYNYRRKQFFMTKAENVFYKELIQLVGNDYIVFAQVHLPTIIDEKINGQDWRASRAHINRKSVDFVLCDKEYISPKLAIELDDWSHSRSDRQERDGEVERILSEAGMPLLRITDTQNLAEKIKEKIAQSS